ncbi:MAG: dTMP kinase [Clostridia bacterium]
MHYDAVLFDLDGTINESAPGICSSVKYAMGRLGLEHLDDATLQCFVGPPLHHSFMKYFHLDAESAAQAITVYREDFAKRGLFVNAVYPGIPNLLRRLHAEGVYVALATAKPLIFAKKILAYFGLLSYFDATIGVGLDARDADKADIVRDALPARFTRAAMVGDRQYDMIAAKQNGITAIGALYGYGSREELEGAGADLLVEDVPALYEALCGDMKQPRGMFMSVEGIDGCGKSTQMELLAAHIRQRGYEVVSTREPGGCAIAEKIRKLVLDAGNMGMTAETEALLYAAARAQHVREVITPALEQGKVVLSDRFVDSSIAYQGGGRNLGLDWVERINKAAIADHLPELTLLFMVDPSVALLRRRNATKLDRIERAGESFFQRVYDSFVAIARRSPERIRCIDASGSVEEVAAEVFQVVDQALQKLA